MLVGMSSRVGIFGGGGRRLLAGSGILSAFFKAIMASSSSISEVLRSLSERITSRAQLSAA